MSNDPCDRFTVTAQFCNRCGRAKHEHEPRTAPESRNHEAMKRPSKFRVKQHSRVPTALAYVFTDTAGVEVEDSSVDNARIAKLDEQDKYIDYLEEKVKAVANAGHKGVSHVGLANYREREAEAHGFIHAVQES